MACFCHIPTAHTPDPGPKRHTIMRRTINLLSLRTKASSGSGMYTSYLCVIRAHLTLPHHHHRSSFGLLIKLHTPGCCSFLRVKGSANRKSVNGSRVGELSAKKASFRCGDGDGIHRALIRFHSPSSSAVVGSVRRFPFSFDYCRCRL